MICSRQKLQNFIGFYLKFIKKKRKSNFELFFTEVGSKDSVSFQQIRIIG